MSTLSGDDSSRLQALEEALTGALTLAEGLAQDELVRARLTSREVRRQLLDASRAISTLSPAALQAMPELDADGWRTIGQRLGGSGAAGDETAWFALQALAPATLDWLRFYRARAPESLSAPQPTVAAGALTIRHFVTYSGVRLPLRLVEPIEEAQLAHRNTFVRAGFDAEGRLRMFEKIAYGQVELSHRYDYDGAGVLRRAVITSDEDETTLELDPAGQPIRTEQEA
jgi:hypothetical protein